MSGYGYNMILTSLIQCWSTASNMILALGRIAFAGIIVKKAKRQQPTIIHKYWRQTLVSMWNSPVQEKFTVVFIARLAGLNLGYPENPALKPRKPS